MLSVLHFFRDRVYKVFSNLHTVKFQDIYQNIFQSVDPMSTTKVYKNVMPKTHITVKL